MARKALKGDLLEKLVPVLLVVSIVLAFAVGILWERVTKLEGGSTKVAGNTGQLAGDAQAPPDTGPQLGKLSEDLASKLPAVSDEDHVRGSRSAKVFLIEYSDFECPFCKSFHATAQQVIDEYGSDVAWVYRHYPLDQIHPKARPAALASECVAELGGDDAFWNFADTIFANQQSTLADLPGTAVGAGVNQSAFQTCFDSDKYADLVEGQLQEGIAAGVRGTPGNFIVNQNGDTWFIPGAYPFDQVKPMIDEALQG